MVCLSDQSDFKAGRKYRAAQPPAGSGYSANAELGSGAIVAFERIHEKQNSSIVRQSRMAKGDFHISWQTSHADITIPDGEVKVRERKRLKHRAK
jgi:hypothetical protein